MTKPLTAKDALEISKDKNKIKYMTISEFKRKGREIVEEYGVTPKEALQLLRGEQLLEIVSRYESIL